MCEEKGQPKEATSISQGKTQTQKPSAQPSQLKDKLARITESTSH